MTRRAWRLFKRLNIAGILFTDPHGEPGRKWKDCWRAAGQLMEEN